MIAIAKDDPVEQVAIFVAGNGIRKAGKLVYCVCYQGQYHAMTSPGSLQSDGSRGLLSPLALCVKITKPERHASTTLVKTEV